MNGASPLNRPSDMVSNQRPRGRSFFRFTCADLLSVIRLRAMASPCDLVPYHILIWPFGNLIQPGCSHLVIPSRFSFIAQRLVRAPEVQVISPLGCWDPYTTYSSPSHL